MATINDMLEVVKKTHSLDLRLYAFNHIWDKQDLHDLTRYEVLSCSALFYIFSDEEQRQRIVDALEENLEISDAENAVKYFILHELNTVEAAEMLFHRIPYPAGIILENRISEDLAATLPAMYLAVTEIYLFTTIAVSPDQIALTLPTFTFRTWLDCQANNLLSADKNCKPFHDNMTFPSLDEFAAIIHDNELEFDPYLSMGDPALDKIAKPICDHFLGWVTDGFETYANESRYPEFYRPFQDSEYYAALNRYRSVLEYIDRCGTYTDEYNDEINELRDAVNEIFALMDELEQATADIESLKLPMSFRMAANYCLLNFFLYLAASDEYISGKEVKAINECLHFNYSRDQIRQMIRDKNIYTVTFERKVPGILEILTLYDRKMDEMIDRATDAAADALADRAAAEKGYRGRVSYATQYVDLCEKAGYLFLQADGNMNEDEKRDLGTIIGNYREFLSGGQSPR